MAKRMQGPSSTHRMRKKFERVQGFGPCSGEWKKWKKYDFQESVLTFVDIVQSSRLVEIDQRSILGFRFFNVEKYGKI